MEPEFSPAPPGFPRRFGSYLLLSPIAQGGMGDVFLASTMGTAGAVRLVVVKTLREDLVSEPGYVNRFLDEARVVIQLQHANISQVFDVGCHEGTHFFVMEHIPGNNLRRLTGLLVRRKVKLPAAYAMYIMSEVLEGLHCAHHHRHALTGEPLQVVHRDVSPQNIMVSLQGEVKLIDFGLAESTLKVEHTESKVVLGKIAYMPPEQARGDEVDARSDQYAAAVVLYELLTGARFYGDRSQGAIWAIAGQGITPDLLPQLDPELGGILKKALSPRAADRFASCGELSTALRTLLAERNPEVDRVALRDFLQQAAGSDLENTDKNLRALSQLALRSQPELATSRGAFVDTSDAGTGATETSILPTKLNPARRARWAAAAGGALVAALTGAFFMVVNAGVEAPPATTTTPSAQTPGPAALPPPAPVIDAAPSVQEPPLEPAPLAIEPPLPPAPVDEPSSPDSVTKTATAKPAVAKNAAGSPRRKPPPKPTTRKEPDRSSWSQERKLDAIRDCQHPCTRTIKSVIERGAALFPPTIDACVSFCLKR